MTKRKKRGETRWIGTTYFCTDEDEKLDLQLFPIVLAYNGHNHYLPAGKLKNRVFFLKFFP